MGEGREGEGEKAVIGETGKTIFGFHSEFKTRDGTNWEFYHSRIGERPGPREASPRSAGGGLVFKSLAEMEAEDGSDWLNDPPPEDGVVHVFRARSLGGPEEHLVEVWTDGTCWAVVPDTVYPENVSSLVIEAVNEMYGDILGRLSHDGSLL